MPKISSNLYKLNPANMYKNISTSSFVTLVKTKKNPYWFKQEIKTCLTIKIN